MTKLTIGMAVYDDYDGLFFTLEALRCYHDLGRYQAEIVVVDNHPDGPFAGDIEHYVFSIREVPARLIRMATPVGTSAPRDAVFENAAGEIVLVMDCHVLLTPGAIPALLDFFHSHPEPALVSGPLVSYDRASVWTHFDPVWRAGMWGIWGSDPRGVEPYLPPFEIPAMGLGLFACRKRHWPGFNPLARGFGGEECYIHEKIRRRGGKAWCLPALRWVHRFHNQKRPTPYPNNWQDRVRNYVLEFLELGRDLEELAHHFVNEHPVVSREEFDQIAQAARVEWEEYLKGITSIGPNDSRPTTTTSTPPIAKSGCGCKQAKPHFDSIAAWWEYEAKSGTINPEILDSIVAAVPGQTRVVHVNPGPSTAAAVLRAQPAEYTAICPEHPRWWWPQALAVAGKAKMTYLLAEAERVRVNAPDIIVVEGVTGADRLLRVLEIHRPARRAVILGIATAGESAPGGGPGLLPAIRKFVRDQPGWLTVKVMETPPGLVILSADPGDRPRLPSAWRQIANFAKAVTQHVVSGAGKVSRQVLEERLSICALCDKRTIDEDGRDRCSVCGCYLIGGITGSGGKAEWASQDCPLGKWPSPEKEEDGFR